MSGNWAADLLNSRKQGPDVFGKGRKEGWTNCDKLESRRAGGTRCLQLMPCRLSEIPERHRFPPSTDVGRWVRSCGLSSRSSSESALCAGIWDILYPPVFICMLYAVCCMLDTYESYYMAMMTSGRHISAQAAILPVVPLGITPPGNNPSPMHFILYVCHRRPSQPATDVHPRRAINRLGRPSGLPSFPRGVGLALTSTNSQISTSLTIPII